MPEGFGGNSKELVIRLPSRPPGRTPPPAVRVTSGAVREPRRERGRVRPQESSCSVAFLLLTQCTRQMLCLPPAPPLRRACYGYIFVHSGVEPSKLCCFQRRRPHEASVISSGFSCLVSRPASQPCLVSWSLASWSCLPPFRAAAAHSRSAPVSRLAPAGVVVDVVAGSAVVFCFQSQSSAPPGAAAACTHQNNARSRTGPGPPCTGSSRCICSAVRCTFYPPCRLASADAASSARTSSSAPGCRHRPHTGRCASGFGCRSRSQ